MDATALSVQALNNVNKCQRVEEAKANDLAVHIATHAMLNPERCILIFHPNTKEYSSCLLSEVQPAELKEGLKGLIRKLDYNVARDIEISVCGNGLAGIMLPDGCAVNLEEDRRTTIMCGRDLEEMFEDQDVGDDSGDWEPSPALRTMVARMQDQLKVHKQEKLPLGDEDDKGDASGNGAYEPSQELREMGDRMQHQLEVHKRKKIHLGDEDDYKQVILDWRRFVASEALAFLKKLEKHERAEARAYCGITIQLNLIEGARLSPWL